MTAELAVAVPAVLLVLAACLGGLRLGVERVRLAEAAAQEARAAARGEPYGPDRGGTVVVRHEGDAVCVEVRRDVPLLGLPVPVAASSCALSGAVG